MPLDLVLTVVPSTVAIAVFGPVISSRRGRDFGTVLLAVVVTLLSLASARAFGRQAANRQSLASALGRDQGLPSGWRAMAVNAAACFTSAYGDDGTWLWLTSVAPASSASMSAAGPGPGFSSPGRLASCSRGPEIFAHL